MELPPSRGRRSPPELFTHYLTLARQKAWFTSTMGRGTAEQREPLATATPDGELLRRYRVRGAAQGELFPAPRKLDGHATAGAMIEAVACLH